MLQNAYFLAKIGADTAENKRNFAQILPKICNYPTGPWRWRCTAAPCSWSRKKSVRNRLDTKIILFFFLDNSASWSGRNTAQTLPQASAKEKWAENWTRSCSATPGWRRGYVFPFIGYRRKHFFMMEGRIIRPKSAEKSYIYKDGCVKYDKKRRTHVWQEKGRETKMWWHLAYARSNIFCI